MNKNLEEIISGITSSQLSALMRAGHMSPYVTERTIGPDLPEDWCKRRCSDEHRLSEKVRYSHPTEKGETQESNASKSNQRNVLGDISKRVSTPERLSVNIGLPSKIKDYEQIKDHVLLRHEQHKELKAVRQEVIESQREHVKLIGQIKQQKNEAIEKGHQNWLENHKLKNDLIGHKATEQALKTQRELEQDFKILHQQKEKAVHKASLLGVQQRQKRFREKCEIISKFFLELDPKDSSEHAADFSNRFREITNSFDQILRAIKSGQCDETELKAAELACLALEVLEQALKDYILKSKQIEEEERQQKLQQQELLEKQEKIQQQLEALKKQEAEEATALAQSTNPEPNTTSQNESTTLPPTQQVQPNPPPADVIDASHKLIPAQHSETMRKYLDTLAFYQERVDRVKPLQSDENFKKFRFSCQKAINIPINSISAVTPQHLQDKFERLYSLFCGQPTNEIRITDHPLGRDYCLLLMAKKFVSQGETEVSSNAHAAFPVASIIVTFWKLIPEFGQLFLAYLYKASPFLVPHYPEHKPGQTLEEYQKVLGYHFTNGQIEPMANYLKRLTGITRLYAAVMTTSGRHADGPFHPHSVDNAWRFFTNIMALEPLEDVCATVISQMLQIVAEPMWSMYGKQFIKQLVYMQNMYVPKLAAVDSGGPRSRLETLLNSILIDGQLLKVQGALQPGYW